MKKLFLLLALISLKSVSVFADDTNGNTDNPPVNKIKFEEMYLYSLIADGKVVSTKKMILTK